MTVLEFATCEDCGLEIVVNVADDEGVCPDCEGELLLDIEPAPAGFTDGTYLLAV